MSVVRSISISLEEKSQKKKEVIDLPRRRADGSSAEKR
jgi:hypothetical protein